MKNLLCSVENTCMWHTKWRVERKLHEEVRNLKFSWVSNIEKKLWKHVKTRGWGEIGTLFFVLKLVQKSQYGDVRLNMGIILTYILATYDANMRPWFYRLRAVSNIKLSWNFSLLHYYHPHKNISPCRWPASPFKTLSSLLHLFT